MATISKDIWHKPIETTDVDNNLIIDDWTNGTYELGYFDDKDMIFRNFRNDDTYYEESMMRWCDVDELIDDYDRTRKALDVAINAMKSAGAHNSINCIARGEDPSKDDVGITINRALNEITALEQKEG